MTAQKALGSVAALAMVVGVGVWHHKRPVGAQTVTSGQQNITCTNGACVLDPSYTAGYIMLTANATSVTIANGTYGAKAYHLTICQGSGGPYTATGIGANMTGDTSLNATGCTYYRMIWDVPTSAWITTRIGVPILTTAQVAAAAAAAAPVQSVNGQTGAVTIAAGAQGMTGYTGATGSGGANGYTGNTGSVGPSGAVGSAGAVGFTGATGTQGIPGYTGPSGATGIAGATGSVGLTGATGSAGAQGVAGISGATGSTGTAGLVGATGPTGVVSATTPIVLTGTVVSCPSCLTTSTILWYSGTTGSIGGSLLALGACASGTATVTGVPVGRPGYVAPSDGSFIGGNYTLTVNVATAGVATVNLCAVVAGTPPSHQFNVRFPAQ